MSPKHILAVFIARNKEFFRDKAALAWSFVMPIMVIMGFAFTFSGEEKDLYTVGMLNVDAQDVTEFQETRFINFVTMLEEDKAIDSVERHRLDFLVDAENSTYWVNKESPNGYLVEKLFLLSLDIGQSFKRVEANRQNIRYIDWLIPGLLSMNMMFGALWGVGYVIVRYRKNGVLKRLQATPLNAAEFLFAQIFSRLWLLIFVNIVVYVVVHFLLDFRMDGRYINLFLVFTLGVFCMISMGLLVASRFANEEVANGILNFIAFPMMFLSEIWFSLEGAHPLVQGLSKLFPLTHLNSAARAIMIDGASLLDVSTELIVMGVITLVCLVAGTALFRWE